MNRLQTLSRLDLLITDVSLPNGRNGFELAQAILQLRSCTRVLFVSSHASSDLARENGWSGEIDLLVKPYLREQLTMRVRARLGPPRDDALRAPAAKTVEEVAPEI